MMITRIYTLIYSHHADLEILFAWFTLELSRSRKPPFILFFGGRKHFPVPFLASHLLYNRYTTILLLLARAVSNSFLCSVGIRRAAPQKIHGFFENKLEVWCGSWRLGWGEWGYSGTLGVGGSAFSLPDLAQKSLSLSVRRRAYVLRVIVRVRVVGGRRFPPFPLSSTSDRQWTV